MGVQTGPTPGPAGWAPRILGTSQPAAPKPVLWSHLEVPSPFYGVFSALKTPQWPTQPCWGSPGHFHQKKKKRNQSVDQNLGSEESVGSGPVWRAKPPCYVFVHILRSQATVHPD